MVKKYGEGISATYPKTVSLLFHPENMKLLSAATTQQPTPNLLATSAAFLLHGTSLKDRIYSTKAIQSSNSSGYKVPNNSWISTLKSNSQRRIFVCTMMLWWNENPVGIVVCMKPRKRIIIRKIL